MITDFEVILIIRLFIKYVSRIFSFTFIKVIVFGISGKENFFEIITPTIINNRTMGNDYYSAILIAANNLKSSQSFAKTHFSIPKHFIIFFEGS